VNASGFLRIAIAGEAGLLLLAWALGRWLGIGPFDQLQLNFSGIIVGAAASVPLLLGLWWILTTEASSVRGLVELVQSELGPVLATRSPASLALLAALAGTAEEILFRGVVQTGLAGPFSETIALIFSSVAFGLAHFLTPMYALLAGVAGLYLGAVFLIHGNLLAPIVAHALYDFVALIWLIRRYRATNEESN
jgi:membrane protease YdiL (CAAX protease family)